MGKHLKFVLNIIIWIFIVIAVAITVLSLNTKEKGVSNLLGYIPLSIQSASMEPTINTGDLIISKKVDHSELEKGDIISFFSIEQDKVVVITHRIVEVKTSANMTSFVTKGDNNPLNDKNEVVPGDVISKYNGVKISNGGYILDFFKSKIGFFVCIILPLFIIFIYQLISFVLLIVRLKHDKNITKG